MNSKDLTPVTERYLKAIELVKKLTATTHGAQIKTVSFCSDLKVRDNFFIILAKQTDILRREKTKVEGESPAIYRYVWNYGSTPITSELAQKIYQECQNWKKKGNEDREEIKSQVKAPKTVVNVAKEKDPIFTPKHLKVLNKLEFKVPTEVEIDETTILTGVKKIEFLIDQSKVILKASIDRYALRDDSDTELIAIYTAGFVNKNFILSQRFEGEKSAAYCIKSVNANTNGN